MTKLRGKYLSRGSLILFHLPRNPLTSPFLHIVFSCRVTSVRSGTSAAPRVRLRNYSTSGAPRGCLPNELSVSTRLVLHSARVLPTPNYTHYRTDDTLGTLPPPISCHPSLYVYVITQAVPRN